ncbi:Metallo-dependent phosphatase-like protein [Scheffersomyces coipomensis]|uniref:Metallo-dependent phosphatase-like protein n=1 Tax=Scheffersomyces coipomensis TaxID=1788519 RepID=UPI00315C75F7
MLTLAIGDLYIPERSVDIPSKFRKLLSPNPNSIPSNNKISEVICLGNIINSNDILKFLYNLSNSFHLVKGEFDDSQILSQQLLAISNKDKPIPLHNVIVHDNLRIGFTNGYQIVPKNDPLALSNVARELDVDILIWGGTHKVEAYTLDGRFFINPGSATGAYTFDWPEQDDAQDIEDESDLLTNSIDVEVLNEVIESDAIIPSFCLLDTQGSTCTLYIYTYLGGEVKVDKVTYTKE